jgi:tripartite-type tricarboxylate transporter receptor subunit TctC
MTMQAISMLVAALILSALAASPLQANKAYPNRTVRIVNPYVADSTTDLLARALAIGLSNRLGQQFIVENRAGAGGALGTASVVRDKADGYTLLFAPALVLSVHPQSRNDAGYKPDSLVPVCQTFTNAMAIAVPMESPIKNIAHLVNAAKQKPGALNYGHQGPLTVPHLAMEEFLQAANISIKDVPFRGEPLVLIDLLDGRIDVASLVLGTATGQNVRILGIFSETRHPSHPDVPTVKEQGYDVSAASFGGLFAPKKTPRRILTKLGSACAGAAKDESYASAAKRAAQTDDYYSDANSFRQRLQRDTERKAEVLRRVAVPP